MQQFQTAVRHSLITLACTGLRPFFALSSRRKLTQPPQRIVVFRRCCLGDTLMMTPLLNALAAAWPQARISYAVGRWSAAGVVNNPHVDQIVQLPDQPTWRDWVRIVGKLRHGNYDLALVPDRSPLPGLALALAGVPRRVGLDSARRGFALTDQVPVLPLRHETDLAFDLARALAVPVTDRRPLYRPDQQAQDRVTKLLASHNVRPPVLVVHPGGGSNPGVTMASKRWPAARFAEVAATLQAERGGTIILVGVASDRPLVIATHAALGQHAHVLDLSEQLSLAELGALCQHASLYLGNDAGTTHLAEASGAPVVAVFGPTDPAQYGPTDLLSEAVWNPLTCGPAVQRGDLTRGAAIDQSDCITTITVAQVLAAARRVLERAGQR